MGFFEEHGRGKFSVRNEDLNKGPQRLFEFDFKVFNDLQTALTKKLLQT